MTVSAPVATPPVVGRESLRIDRFLDHGGFTTHYWDQGSGPPVVLLHGIADSCLAWHPVLDALSTQFRCIAPDMPGFGFSTRPDRITPATYTDWLQGFLDGLGLDEVALVGHSLGGLLTLLFALDHPSRVWASVLVSSAGLGRDVPMLLRAMSLPLLPRLIYRSSPSMARKSLLALTANRETVTPEFVEWSWQYNGARPGFARHMADITRLGGSMLFGMSRKFVLIDRLGELRAPLHLIWGDRDPLFPLRHAHRAIARRPDAELTVLTGVAHLPMLEQPEAFSRSVTTFLTRADPSRWRGPAVRARNLATDDDLAAR